MGKLKIVQTRESNGHGVPTSEIGSWVMPKLAMHGKTLLAERAIPGKQYAQKVTANTTMGDDS